MSQKIVVLGAGNFGTCLAQHLAKEGQQVTLWARRPEVAESINTLRRNPNYLGAFDIDSRVSAESNLEKALSGSTQAIVLAVPLQNLRELLTACKPTLLAAQDFPVLICTAKGIEQSSLKFSLQIIEDVLGANAKSKSVYFSGPSFANEIMRGLPTAVSIAGDGDNAAQVAQEIFHSPSLRVYTTQDPIALEVSGALKNVIAVAAGAVAGLGFENNTLASITTRGLYEIIRIGGALGAQPTNFCGLGGAGDLYLTCFSNKSRNYTLGFELGRGATVEKALANLTSVAEGYYTSKSAYELIKKLGIEAPIIEQVYEVLYQNKPVLQAVEYLTSRAPREEFE